MIFLAILLFLSLPAWSSALASEQWWQKRPYLEWSTQETTLILDYSPWVALAPAGVRQETHSGRPLRGGGRSGRGVNVHYQFRLLTARPIREAFVRMLCLNRDVIHPYVNLRDLATPSSPEEQQKCPDKWISSHPNTPITAGQEKYIIIAVNLRIGIFGSLEWREEPEGQELSNTDTLDLTNSAKLITNSKRKVSLFNYKPPGPDWLGLLLFFPRDLPDGKPLIAPSDKGLYFEAQINRKKVRVRFDLAKMVYKGKLEF